MVTAFLGHLGQFLFLFRVLNYLQAANHGQNSVLLLWDLSAAFDTLDHTIFIKHHK